MARKQVMEMWTRVDTGSIWQKRVCVKPNDAMRPASLICSLIPLPRLRTVWLASCWVMCGWAHAAEPPSAVAPEPAPVAAAVPVQSKILMRTQTSWDGKPLVFKEGPGEVSALYVEIAPGAQTGWHQHPVPNFAYMLEGELEISLKDGRINRVKAGDALAEVVQVLHNGRNPSAAQAAKLVVFYMGGIGIPLTTPEVAPAN
jgi:quercetin dioxygenase-like cupin family protein